MNPDIVKIIYSALIVKGKLEPIDIVTVMITEMQSKSNKQRQIHVNLWNLATA